MRQVPNNANTFSYVIIGNGKLAQHIIHYFQLMEIDYSHWFRKSQTSLSSLALENKKILILINDDAIEEFIIVNKLDKLNNSILIHCSGMLATKLALGLHPLMTFSNDMYDLDTYKKIPIGVDSNEIDIQQVFPELPNQFFNIPFEKKNLYHAWCSMAGNFTSILWMNFFETIQKEFGLDKNIATPYMNKIFSNLQNLDDPLTGPLKRGDKKTINTHLQSLENHPFEDVYKSFVKAYNKKS